MRSGSSGSGGGVFFAGFRGAGAVVAGSPSGCRATVTDGATASDSVLRSTFPPGHGNAATHGSVSGAHGLCSSVASSGRPSTTSVGRMKRMPRTPDQRPRTTSSSPFASARSTSKVTPARAEAGWIAPAIGLQGTPVRWRSKLRRGSVV